MRGPVTVPDVFAGLASHGPELLRPAFHAFALDYQVAGRFVDGLGQLKVRLADPSATAS